MKERERAKERESECAMEREKGRAELEVCTKERYGESKCVLARGARV